MKSYSKGTDEMNDRVRHILKCFHPELVAAGLCVDVLSVASDNEDAPALTHQGYPAAAVIRVVDSKGRTMDRGDVEIVIDEENYMGMSDTERDALVDHELYHVELKRSPKSGRVKLDENGRPKCGLRKHDYQMGHFVEIAKRHGAASLECRQMRRILLAERQTLFAFIEEPAMLDINGDAPEPSDKVKAIAKEILGASPAVQSAARNLVSNLRKQGITMTARVVPAGSDSETPADK